MSGWGQWGWLFKTKGEGAGSNEAQAETPEFYLKLTKTCMKEVDSMLSSGASTSPKFNHEQCKYLADKLRMVVQRAHFLAESTKTWYTGLASNEDRAQSLDLFRLLFALGKEVESFIQGCCKDAWLQSVFLLTCMPEGIASLGFELECCRKGFSIRSVSPETLTVSEVSALREAEVEIVAEKAHIDKLSLIRELNAFILSSKASAVELQQTNFLLERLKSATMGSGTNLSRSSGSRHPDIRISSLRPVKLLGRGSYGLVHEVNWLGIGVARKTFHGPHPPDFEREISILEGLRHPNIVSLLWHTRNERNCYMIMELMDKDLYTLMQERMEECGYVHPPFDISEAVHIMLQMAEGIRFLHEQNVVHRDVKSGNILVKLPKARGVGVTNLHVKVADFGLSKTKKKSETYSEQTPNQGTARWMAPEMIANVAGEAKTAEQEEELRYPFKVDVYSFAMVCYEILTGELPFSDLGANALKAKVLGGGHPQLPYQCPERLKNLIEACWSTEPCMRPSFDGICAELREWKCGLLFICDAVPAIRSFTVEVVKNMTNKYNEDKRLRLFSEVCKRCMVDTGEVVAVNKGLNYVPVSEFNNRNMRIEVLSRLHPYNVVRCMGVCIVGVETPERYLKLTKRCMKEVDGMLSVGGSTSPKFNHEQCKYLANKLRVVVQRAHLFFESTKRWYTGLASNEDRAQSLELFKLLFALGKEVESFIQKCCKDAWLQSVFLLTCRPEGISSLGFELEVYTKVFTIWTGFASPLTGSQMSVLREAEVEIVAEKANIDKWSLNRKLDAFTLSSKACAVELQQAIFLLEQLKSGWLGSY